jgi:3-oxoacyl-ACP reductase-like protein
MKLFFALLTVGAMLIVAASGEGAGAATLSTPEKAAEIASLRNVAVKNGEVSGEIVNHSRQTLREVQLQILYSWRWKDEFHPGKDDPGRAAYHVVGGDIAAGQSAQFTYKPSPPLAPRNDGTFDISVKIVGFAEVFR